MKATEHMRATVLVRTTQKRGVLGVTLHKDVHHKRTARDGAGEARRDEQQYTWRNSAKARSGCSWVKKQIIIIIMKKVGSLEQDHHGERSQDRLSSAT